MNSHPQTTLSAGTGGLTTLILYLAELKHWHVDPILAAGIVTAATSVAFFIGRKGIRGVFTTLWQGNPTPPKP